MDDIEKECGELKEIEKEVETLPDEQLTSKPMKYLHKLKKWKISLTIVKKSHNFKTFQNGISII